MVHYQIIYSLPDFLYITHTGKCLETLICLSRTLGKKSLNFGLKPENINKKYCINHVIKGWVKISSNFAHKAVWNYTNSTQNFMALLIIHIL